MLSRSTDRILTTHVGKLPAPNALYEAMLADPSGRPRDAGFTAKLAAAVDEVVKRQCDTGIDIPGDGELGRLSWNSYLSGRLGGYERKPLAGSGRGRGSAEPEFAEFYREANERGLLYYQDPIPAGPANPRDTALYCTGPITYIGHEALRQDIEYLQSAMRKHGVQEAFMPSTAPNAALERNEYYRSEEEQMFAVADALHEEYQAIADAGLVLQIDMPGIGAGGNTAQELRIEALNHALEGIPEEQVRLHVCWGGWNGPHTSDPTLRESIPSMLKIRAAGFSIEAANPRHEHEWRVWEDVRLPEGKVLYPGFVSQKTNVVEHPEAIAWRIRQYADVVGRENVVASTDCGLGSRVHPLIAWAKLRSLAEGAALVSRELWGR